ncbi:MULTISPECIES: hypothetical protein [unclassified Kaistella]|uniref:hypothetical protein n=1 Tax=unclassified Kaistella TaxID=2762626 RepID=UPI002732CC22|nr:MULTISPECIES: hypothetical protein [unclassified Kaistella]MDP2453676.1 hypothetical protein [Kaistella sp. SH11-4b]MDP2456733.1 hypothetical protein [Kaistella sp. SH40-3]MDP2459489.1 hypothetical protein [Kaistella sp. SH19-2b]
MKTIKNTAIFFFLLVVNFAFACDACKLQQPKVTRDFTHGVGPRGDFDWIIVAVIAVITILTFIYSLKFLVKPGEKDRNHIKNSILN